MEVCIMKKLVAVCSSIVLFSLVGTNSVGADILGSCKFDTRTLTFPGAPQEQAKCLLRPVKIRGNLGPILTELPPNLKRFVGTPMTIDRTSIRKLLLELHLAENDIGGSLDKGLSHAKGGKLSAPQARYFVIHDTSQNQGNRPFPPDDSTSLNSFDQFKAKRPAHIFNNRLPVAADNFYVANSLDTPWRATQLEKKTGTDSKGLFIHVENTQARKRDPSNPNPDNDNFASNPGFTDAQYTKLALLYIIVSRRAGSWMIPAYHAVLDSGGVGDHDDPQNFDLMKFDGELGKLVQSLSN
jgi:hypothetical protein